MQRIIAITNQKGGVGKTTNVINIAAALKMLGKKILLIDMDPQGGLGIGLGIEPESLNKSVYDVIVDNLGINKIKEKKKVGEREEDIEEKIKTLKEPEVETIKEITFEEHPLLTKDPFYKVSVCLSEKENEYLESFGKKAKLTGGNKISKNMIIRGFVKAFMDVKLDVIGLKKDDDKILFERVRGFIKK